jgi:hypothetical protein
VLQIRKKLDEAGLGGKLANQTLSIHSPRSSLSLHSAKYDPLTLSLSPRNGGEGTKKLELIPSPVRGEGAQRAGDGVVQLFYSFRANPHK